MINVSPVSSASWGRQISLDIVTFWNEETNEDSQSQERKLRMNAIGFVWKVK